LPPFPAADLSEKIASLGHKVTRYNPTANTISVCLADGKKAHRFFVDRLLQEAAELGVSQPPPTTSRLESEPPPPLPGDIDFP
jgi:hypothetical protein